MSMLQQSISERSKRGCRGFEGTGRRRRADDHIELRKPGCLGTLAPHLGAARSLFTLSRAQVLPAALGWVHAGFSTPHVAIAFVGRTRTVP